MQTITINDTAAALKFAWFLQDRGTKVEFLNYRDGKGILKINMSPCKLPARHETPSGGAKIG